MGKGKKKGNAPAANAEQPKAEQPKAEQPKAEPPKAEQPKAEPPKAEPPKAEPAKEQPKAEPAKQQGGKKKGGEAKKEEPKKEEPKKEEVKKEEPKKEEPAKTEQPKGTQLGGTQLGGPAQAQSGGGKKKKQKKDNEDKEEKKEEGNFKFDFSSKPASSANEGNFKFDFGNKPAPASGGNFKFDFSAAPEDKEPKEKGGKKKKGKAPKVSELLEEEEEDEIPERGGSVFQDPALLKALSKKMNSLIGQTSGYLETLPRAVQDRIKALKHIQEAKGEIEKAFKKELEELEKKYEAQYVPLYQKRSDIVNGVVEPTSEEIGDRVAELDNEGKEIKGNKQGSNITGIPEFWLQAMKHHPDFEALIEPKDEEALKFLTDVKYTDLEEGKLGFALEFYFKSNPFFEETVLRKEYHEEDTPQGVIYDHVVPAKITWKPGKNLTVKKVTKKKGGGRRGRGGKGGAPQSITVEEPTTSFFNFFDPEKMIDLIEAEDEEEAMDHVSEILEADYDLGAELKEKVIPNAVLWFTGEAEVPEFDELEEGPEDEEEEEFGSEEEDEDYKPDPNEKPPECKQQ